MSSVDNVSAAGMPEGAGGGREAAEARSAGAVAGAVYAAYLRAAGHPLLVALTLAVTALAQLLGSGSDWWTSYWSVHLVRDSHLPTTVGHNGTDIRSELAPVNPSSLIDFPTVLVMCKRVYTPANNLVHASTVIENYCCEI